MTQTRSGHMCVAPTGLSSLMILSSLPHRKATSPGSHSTCVPISLHTFPLEGSKEESETGTPRGRQTKNVAWMGEMRDRERESVCVCVRVCESEVRARENDGCATSTQQADRTFPSLLSKSGAFLPAWMIQSAPPSRLPLWQWCNKSEKYVHRTVGRYLPLAYLCGPARVAGTRRLSFGGSRGCLCG
ncbi:hypothetical protein LZ30DRAFT_324689 [Colletotrichum cereale]|nr:hypothetical protein LZ30DRAFT_324689 [Colletotrichum cereale]